MTIMSFVVSSADGTDFDPLDVEKALRVPATRMIRVGQPHVKLTTKGVRDYGDYHHGVWILNSAIFCDARKATAHLHWLWSVIGNKEEAITELAKRYKCIVHFSGVTEDKRPPRALCEQFEELGITFEYEWF